MTVAPHAGIVDFGTFTSPTSSVDGIQGEVPQPLAGQQNYVLTANGWVALSSLGTLVFQGTWDASTNTPTLVSSVGVQGYYYVVSVAGNTDLNGITTWTEGDWAIFSGSVWQKIEGGSTVNITGGTINNTVIGNTTPAAGTFTTITGQTGVLRGTGQNAFLQSETFENASWAKTNLTVTANTSSAPDGTTTAETIDEGTASGTHLISQSTNILANTKYTFSCYGKNVNGVYLVLSVRGANGNIAAAEFNISTGALSKTYAIGTGFSVDSTSITAVGNDWYRCVVAVTSGTTVSSQTNYIGMSDGSAFATSGSPSYTGTNRTILIWGSQFEFGSTANTYIPTTTTAVYGTPTLSFSGVSTLGLESNGALFLQPAGTGALQAQATTSTTAGGNARGANAVDLQTSRTNAAFVASGSQSTVGGGASNRATSTFGTASGGNNNNSSGFGAVIAGGNTNISSGAYSFVGAGEGNVASNYPSAVVAGSSNTAAGNFNFIGGGFTNSGTSGSAVTTQSGTMNATTAVTLSGSNANIKVGQYITGTSISGDTYVAAISGTSLTLSKNASGSSTSTLSFFTPHGVVVGGGNNQATGSYSFIGGGGDAGTAANRNVASGLYSAVVGGRGNSATAVGAFVGGGGAFSDTLANLYPNTASGIASSILGGLTNTASSSYSSVLGGFGNTANGTGSTVLGIQATTRSISGNFSFSSCDGAVAFVQGVSQTSILTLGRQTTDATATALTSNSSAAGTTNQVILPNNSAYYFKGSVIANVTGAANGAAWSIEGAIMRGANAASTVLIDTPSVNRVACSAGATAWVVAVTADTTNGGLAVTVTGVASTTIRWVAKLESTEVTF